MQNAVSKGQAEGQGQRKLSPMIAGVGAAVIAAGITIAVMTSGTSTSPTTGDQAAVKDTRQCQLIQRRLLVATDHGGGTVRFRASGWLSPPFNLTKEPQVVVFPLLRPDTDPVPETVMIEGNATDLVITSEVVVNSHTVVNVPGSYQYNVIWAPRKGC
jgi:hypothetical protein